LNGVPTSFTFQGELQQAGSPDADACDFEFSLRDGDGDPDSGTKSEVRFR
jgi:hypothetical protein